MKCVRNFWFLETVLVEDDDENSQSAEVLNTENTTGTYNVLSCFVQLILLFYFLKNETTTAKSYRDTLFEQVKCFTQVLRLV